MLRGLKTAALLELGRLARTAREASARAEPRLQYGVPHSYILDHAKQVHVEMIVMGTEGSIGWDRLRLGSTAQAVIREAPCPVLAVHGGLAGDLARHPARVSLRPLLAATDFSSCAESALRSVARLAA